MFRAVDLDYLKSFCAVLSRGGLPPHLVHQLHTGTNYAAFCHNLSMSWLDKKLPAVFAWSPTIIRVIPYILHCQVGVYSLLFLCFIPVFYLCVFDELYFRAAKMWGVGAEQGGILQTSSGKMELKEPYYRMSQPQIQPQAYAGQDQQPQQLMQQQVQVAIMTYLVLLSIMFFCCRGMLHLYLIKQCAMKGPCCWNHSHMLSLRTSNYSIHNFSYSIQFTLLAKTVI